MSAAVGVLTRFRASRWTKLRPTTRIGVGAGGVAVAVAFPHVVNGYWCYLGALILVYAIANAGFQVVVGWSGQLALAHAAFLGLGAYASTILAKRTFKITGYTEAGEPINKLVWSGRVPYIVGMLLVPIVCAGIGYLLGLPAARLKGFFLAIATLSFGGMIQRLFFEFKDITAGGEGLRVDVLRIGDWDKTVSIYYICLAVAVPVFFVIGRLMRGRFGRTLMAVRDVDIAASSLGVNVTRYRLIAFGISAGVAALAGGLYAQVLTFISPNEFGTARLTALLTMIIVGSVIMRAGAVIGAAFIVLVDQFFVKFPAFKDSPLSGSYRNIAFGLALMLCIGVLPGGLASIPDRLRTLGRSDDDDESGALR